MPVSHADYKKWGGAGAVALLSDYADAKMHRFTTSVSNGQILQIGAVAAQVFTRTGAKYRDWIDGAADYAVGNLIRQFVGPHIVRTTVTTPTVTVTATPSRSAVTAATPGGTGSGFSGVPASSGSAVFDQPSPGF